MKKLFKSIRHNDLEEVRVIIEKKPELVSCISTPPPKKDAGQSPLQVAIKVDAFDIAYYLIEKGADVNFMESEECGNKWRMPLLHDCIMGIFISMCYGMSNADISNEQVALLKTLLEHGADPNKRNTSDMAALDECVHRASYVLDHENYSDVYDFVEKQLERVLDLLLEHGADIKAWADENYLPHTNEFGTNRSQFIDDFKPVPDRFESFTIKGHKVERIIKGDIDRTARTRACIQAYCVKHNMKM